MEWLIGIFASLFGALVSNAIGTQQAATARKETFEYNEKAAENADARSRALYNDIQSPEAQIAGLKKANLSPSLFYNGGTGGGITSGAQGNGGGNYMPQTFGINPLEGAQIKLAEAQAQNLNADTANKEKEGKNIEAKAASEIAKNWADAGLSKAATEMQKAQKTMQDLINYVKDQTKEIDIYTAYAMLCKTENESNRAFEEARKGKVEAEIAEETKDEYIKQVQYENAEILARIATTKAQKKLTEQQIENLKNDILVAQQNLLIAWKNTEVAMKQADNTEMANKIANAARKDAMTRFNAELKTKYKELSIQEDHMLYEFGERIIKRTEIGNQYSVITYNAEEIEYKKAKK